MKNRHDLVDALASVNGTTVRTAVRTTGSFLLIYFSSKDNALTKKGELSLLVEFSEWTLKLRDMGDVFHLSNADRIDLALAKLVGLKAESSRLEPGLSLQIFLEQGSLSVSSLEGCSPEDQAWTLFDETREESIEAWTVTCNHRISFWRGKQSAPREG